MDGWMDSLTLPVDIQSSSSLLLPKRDEVPYHTDDDGGDDDGNTDNVITIVHERIDNEFLHLLHCYWMLIRFGVQREFSSPSQEFELAVFAAIHLNRGFARKN
ncbi:hypothetical protein LOAG_03773 [Loa loa]|uniref:Uncharacterized protein n=1 Tax=Loa loa TaxID=7209 RepID=A0A1S0U3Q0_LOALO|nr:hypothetical protein LOAG_03773 [Loa loa]EFO24715.1 hypothetical protein LOAG_03773 [Loa loa]